MTSVWISRGQGDKELKAVQEKVAFTLISDTMGETAGAAKEEFADS